MTFASILAGGISPCLKVVHIANTLYQLRPRLTVCPTGRSLNSCKMTFYSMQSQHAHPPAPAAPMPRPDATPIDPSLRKRPLFPAEKPLAPRAIQPRPPASTASYSSESSAQLSPRLDSTVAGEPPRKRGRPSKAETERRKAAAEARGETYPPPRRSGSGRLKIPPSPTSPVPGATIAPYQPSSTPQPGQSHGQSSMQYEVRADRPIASAGLPGAEERREKIPTRSMGRELPRPQEMSHPLPSPHALQLGPPDSFPRLNSHPGDRASYGAFPSDRFPSPDNGRRDSVASRGEPPPPPGPGPYERRTSSTPGEKSTRYRDDPVTVTRQ